MLVTKWKRFSRNALNKTIAFVLLVICLLIGVFSGLNIFLKVENYESITVANYLESNTLSSELSFAASRLEYVLRYYKSEQFIKKGGTVRDIDISDSWQLTNLYNNFLAEKNYENNKETEEIFWQEKSEEISEIKEIIIKSDLSNYEQIIYDLNTPEGLIYFATDGVNICTNTDDANKNFYDTSKAYVLIDDEAVIIHPENGENSYSPSLKDRFKAIEEGSDETVIYIAITDEGLLTRTEKWSEDRQNLIKNTSIILFCSIFVLIFFIHLLVVAGKKVGDEEIHLIFIDKIYTDINLLIVTLIVAISILWFDDILGIKYFNLNLMIFTMLLSVALISTLFLNLFLSIVKHLKKGTLIKHSLVYIILSKSIEIIIKIIYSGPLMLKTMLAIITLMISTLFTLRYPPLFFVLLVITTYVVYLKIKSFKIIQEGIKIAKQGDYENIINLQGYGEFKKLADDINTITDGLKIAVKNGVKSEKLKSELITNVSHDIKTPLTSIISYVDLLKREGLQSPNAPKYLDVLDRKSNRLKTLTEDLFEAAKLTSGNIAVNFEKVNLNALVFQILGELDEKIQESKLVFKVNLPEEKIFASADGRLLSRVMENLLSNIFKYALNASRVYIDIAASEKEVSVCFKNVSAYALNIPVEELMERFKRGDESRNSEGNGLGLSIARSLMEIQKGTLTISIDGDLFKAEIALERWIDDGLMID